MERRRRERDEPEPERPPAPAAPPPVAVLDLQRSAGNAAVTRMLQREPVGLGMRGGDPLRPKAPPSPFGADVGSTGVGRSYAAAVDAVNAYFDRAVKEAGSAGLARSLPELVAAARELAAGEEGGTVGDVYSAEAVEEMLRRRAKSQGVALLETRPLDDREGIAAEAIARLKNLAGQIPTEISFGGDDANITVGIGGTVTSKLKPGGGKTTVEGEISKDGGKASVKFPGGKAGVEIPAGGGVKLDLKAGDLVSVKGSVKPAGDRWEWKADLQIGTLGKVLGAEDIAKVMAGAQKSLGGAAQDLADGVSLDAIKQHGGPVKEAVSGAVEKARKSAEQRKGGWQVGVGVQGGGKDGGVSATVTLTWVF